ncbi:Late embryogenesis abundant protein [Heracleum sosnowskyi]|uniref:Late embryogenesis abundant protein n=1 Tax=Heracleum sosnowskyi TaxID=360622 RepID=A0AAD8HAX0_9APIA|nr:Late embryogenesis abundant protein [Heracleum sosnowskyi]
MLHTKSESDVTSLATSSPSRSSPKRPVYFVQSPSRDSHDGDKSSSMQPTPNFNSPMESPSHPSYGRHSRNSSSSRFSGIFRSSSGRKGGRKRNDKGWPECNVIVEEGDYDDENRCTRRYQALIALLGFIVLFTVFCLIIWGAARPFKAEVSVKSLAVNNIFVGMGPDFHWRPNKYAHSERSTPVDLIYSDVVVATGQLKKYFQPRKSHRTVLVNLEGLRVPLYGAGSAITETKSGYQVPLELKFEIRSRGDVVGKLVTTRHRKHISCSLVIDTGKSKPIKFKRNSCEYS